MGIDVLGRVLQLSVAINAQSGRFSSSLVAGHSPFDALLPLAEFDVALLKESDLPSVAGSLRLCYEIEFGCMIILMNGMRLAF